MYVTCVHMFSHLGGGACHCHTKFVVLIQKLWYRWFRLKKIHAFRFSSFASSCVAISLLIQHGLLSPWDTPCVTPCATAILPVQ